MNIHRINKLALVVMTLGTGLMSCSELDDYNTTPRDNMMPTADLTVWQNIKNNPKLTQFAEAMERTGYDKELANSKTYTVWAPLDNTYDAQNILKRNDKELLDQFVKNHIASYSHTLKTGEHKRINTLNGKSYDFTEASYGEQAMDADGQPCRNGTLYTIQGRQQFYPNLYEYIMSTEGIDSLQNYYKRFERTYLDTKASIPGPIVGGKQTYIDSVMVTTNNLFSRLRANINVEDSSYTALLPTDEAWIKAYDRIRPYFKYAPKTVSEDLSNENLSVKKTCNINDKVFGDSLTRNAIIGNIFFNNNDHYNRWVTDDSYTQTRDTLYSTGRTVFPNGNEILGCTVEQKRMSNGMARIIDSLAFAPSTWAPEIIVAGSNTGARPRVQSALPSVVRFDSPDEINLEKGLIMSYLNLEPSGTRALPDVHFYLSDVLSTTYEIYAIIVPADIKKGYAGEVKPNKFSAALTYCDEKGNLRTETLGDAFINDVTKADAVLLGTKAFPIAYKGLGSDFHPSLEIKANLRIFNKDEMATYDRQLRIAAIILKPVGKNQ